MLSAKKLSFRIFSIILVLSFTAFPLNLNAQEKYLAAVQAGGTEIPVLEKLGLKIFHVQDDVLITALSSREQSELSAAGIDYRIIDQKAYSGSSGHYYIAADKLKKNAAFDVTDGTVLYRNGHSAIIRSAAAPVPRDGFVFTELKEFSSSAGIRSVLDNTGSAVQSSAVYALAKDDEIASVVSKIYADSVRKFIQGLQDFGTRFLLAPTQDRVAEWIKQQFIRMGYEDVKIDSFWNNSRWQKNVVATLKGSVTPTEVYVVGGHHDSYSSGNPMVFAPGADDNASGTTAALEIARAIRSAGYIPKSTIKFITFAAEEYGLYGSEDYAAKASAAGETIRLMLNHDMISYTDRPAGAQGVNINRYSGFTQYADLTQQIAGLYTDIKGYTGNMNSSGSDSYSFFRQGYPAVYFEEEVFSPFYHTPGDTITNYNMSYCAQVIKASCATLLTFIKMPPPVDGLVLKNKGDGSTLLADWNYEPNAGIQKFRITVPAIPSYSAFADKPPFEVTGLNPGVEYKVEVRSVNADGNESVIASASAAPASVPALPVLSAVPEYGKIRLVWGANRDLDFAGYDVYRTDSITSTVRLNASLLNDTTYTDEKVLPGVFYYYTVRGVDKTGNASSGAQNIRSRAVTLNQGILIVDDTFDGDGSYAKPEDKSVDEYYDRLFGNFRRENYDIRSQGQPDLSVLGAYSTIIWHNNDLTETEIPANTVSEIAHYLDMGGRLLYTGFLPSRAFARNTSIALKTYKTGEFIYDYLGIKSSENKYGARFAGAVSLPDAAGPLFADSSKTPQSSAFCMQNIEAIDPVDSSVAVFTYLPPSGATSIQAYLKDRPVGVLRRSAVYKVFTLSVPLYYVRYNDAQNFTDYVIHYAFGEPIVGVKKNEVLPAGYSLDQNYPNPFNPSTIIRYQLPSSARVTLRIYDVLGKETAVLFDGDKPAGIYDEVFDTGRYGLSSGVYFYVLRATDNSNGKVYQMTRKLTLIK